jgi:hypothetical protein
MHVRPSSQQRCRMTDIPTLRPSHEMPPIRNSQDLCLHWRTLMSPLGFSQPRLWIGLIQPNDRMRAEVIQIEEIPRAATANMCEPLLEMCEHIVGRRGAGGSVTFLLTRPGRDPMNNADRTWARGLTSAAQQLGVSMWPVHFANDVELRVFAPDDLLVSR